MDGHHGTSRGEKKSNGSKIMNRIVHFFLLPVSSDNHKVPVMRKAFPNHDVIMYLCWTNTRLEVTTYNGTPRRSFWCCASYYGSCWSGIWHYSFNTLRPTFADDIFTLIFSMKTWILITISLQYVPGVQINSNPVLVLLMAWRHVIIGTNWVLVYWRIPLGLHDLTLDTAIFCKMSSVLYDIQCNDAVNCLTNTPKTHPIAHPESIYIESCEWGM